jgi:hypothetical protein
MIPPLPISHPRAEDLPHTCFTRIPEEHPGAQPLAATVIVPALL